MRTFLAAVAALAFVVGAFGCVQAPVVPPLGTVYSGIEAPLDVDFEGTTVGLKSGEASSICILGLVSVGDASTTAAAKEGGIATIHTADYAYTNVLGIYQEYKTIVYGE